MFDLPQRSPRLATDPHTAGPTRRAGTWILLRKRWHALLRSLGRKQLRNNEFALMFVAALLGVAVGFGVVLVHQALQWMHEASFGMPRHRLLSEGVDLDWSRVLLVPPLGGLAVGLTTVLIRRWRPREVVDAIEANALYGGKMSLVDSANLTLLTMLSGGFGASVGLEAAYTQLGAGSASKMGQFLRARRDDLRTLVGCGAAAAIAAAFNAPLAGAFYAFELVIGSYSSSALAPVIVAALAGTFTARWTLGPEPIFSAGSPMGIGGWDYPLFAILGVGSAGLGIITMLAVTWIERGFRRRSIPVWLRPVLGGLAVSIIAFFFPQVLGSGHGAIQEVVGNNFAPLALFLLVPAKALASAISVGSGFRGGLFSSGLFLGALFGSAAGGFLAQMLPGLTIDQLAYALVGMGSVAAVIVGAPVTMIFLILEVTGDFYIAVGVMVGVIVASTLGRLMFGYSFATWRFHMRGVPIRGALDIGWLHDLTVGRLMRGDVHTIRDDLPLAEFRRQFPLGGPKWAFLLDGNGDYGGMVSTADGHNPDLDERLASLTVGDLKQGATHFLLPHQDVRVALQRFANSELEVLPVLASATDRKVIGFLTEAYALRRYTQELERARGQDLSSTALFGPA